MSDDSPHQLEISIDSDIIEYIERTPESKLNSKFGFSQKIIKFDSNILKLLPCKRDNRFVSMENDGLEVPTEPSTINECHSGKIPMLKHTMGEVKVRQMTNRRA